MKHIFTFLFLLLFANIKSFSQCTADAGPLSVTVCVNNSSYTLNGSVTGGTALWATTGSGTFSPNNTALNAVYTPSAAEKTAGYAFLTLTTVGCGPVRDSIFININPSPITNAGPDQVVCANQSAITLNGAVSGATGGMWTTSGTGSFANPNSLTTNYIPSGADISSGVVSLTLTSTGNGVCSAVSDNVVITLSAGPVVNAGADQSVCGHVATTLNGIVTGATGGIWTTTGGGTFAPSNTTLNATYTPSAGDTMVILTMTSTGNGVCSAVADQVMLNFTSGSPSANAGLDQTVCGSATLNGIVTGATGGHWTSSGTGSFANANALSTAYTPSAADVTSGVVTLTLTSTGNGTCSAVTDNVVITLSAGPVVNAGVDVTVCANNASVTLNGSVSGATGGHWTTSGTGSFSNANVLNPTYTPSGTDSSMVTLILTSTGNGACSAVSDNLIIIISPAPTVNAGPDQSVCPGQSITLNGTVTNASTYSWSGGIGTFAPNNTTLNAVYTPSAGEIAAGTITLTFTASRAGCNAVANQVVITIGSGITVNAGLDQTVCGTATLNGIVTGATGGHWTSSGTGSFVNANVLSTSYTPSAADITAGAVTLTLASTGNGTCTAVSDNVTISITGSGPVVNAGADQSVCGHIATTLSGTVTGATGGIWTTTGGGTFAPNNTTLTATYTPSVGDTMIVLTLTSTGNGACIAATDQKFVSFSSGAPVVNAGADQTVCGNSTITLSGSISNISGTWATSGTGTFGNINSLNTVYYPSTTDRVAGSVTLTLTSATNGGCTPVSDNTVITLTPSPTVNAGANQTLNSGAVTLNGTVTGATGGHWVSSGTGTFANANVLNTTYTPSGADVAAHTVTLTLTSTGNGLCNASSDNMVLTGNAVVCNVAITATATNNSIHFSATNADGTSVGSYFWNFGDGTYASGKVQNHVYANAGSYNASVFYTTPDSSCSVTEYKLVTIAAAPISTYSLNGSILAGGNQLDLGVVSLFKLTNSNYDLLLTKALSPSDNGSYSFSNLDNGYYLVHAYINPTSSYYSNYLASYYGGVSAWGSAVAINVNNGNVSSQNINLVAYTSPDVTWNTGSDTIKGVITFDASVVFARVAAATENPVENALVTLYNNSGDKLESVYTDAFGNYSFEKIKAGNYTVKVEYAGGTTPTASLAVAVDGNPATVSTASTEVLKQAIALGISGATTVSSITMYPNPVASDLTLELPVDANGLSTLYIYDAVGQLKYKADHNIVSGDKLTVETNNLNAGFYIVEMVVGEKIYKGKITKK